MSDDIVARLREVFLADAVERREITNGLLAERLIRERHEAADEITNLRADLAAANARADELREELHTSVCNNDALVAAWKDRAEAAEARERETFSHGLEVALQVICEYPDAYHKLYEKRDAIIAARIDAFLTASPDDR